VIQKPQELFESDFVISVFTQLLQYAGKYRNTTGTKPCGAVGLAAASVRDIYCSRRKSSG
jgi:hypothetical protein